MVDVLACGNGGIGAGLMTTPPPIKCFLAQLRGYLRVEPALAEFIVAEVEDHLIDALHKLEGSGLTDEQAAHQVISRFGMAEEIANDFYAESGVQPAYFYKEVGMKTGVSGRYLAFRISIYFAVASVTCFLCGYYAGLQPRLPAAQQAIRVWLQHSNASVQTVWFQLGVGTLAFALGLAALAWREWKEALIRSRPAANG